MIEFDYTETLTGPQKKMLIEGLEKSEPLLLTKEMEVEEKTNEHNRTL